VKPEPEKLATLHPSDHATTRPEHPMDLTTDSVASRAPRRVVVLNEGTVVNRRRVEDREESLAGIVADAESRPADAIASVVTAGNLVHFPWEEWSSCG
jgi:hypothetical protein